jgi:hypothetical protein
VTSKRALSVGFELAHNNPKTPISMSRTLDVPACFVIFPDRQLSLKVASEKVARLSGQTCHTVVQDADARFKILIRILKKSPESKLPTR